MPNWCHNTLTVTGDAEELAAFVEKAKPADGSQPLAFASHVPEPSQEELAALSVKEPCWLCAATGKRPATEAEAVALAAEHGHPAMAWPEAMADPDGSPRQCNGCRGTGLYTREAGWLAWRSRHWGCKWDASFDGPFMALGSDSADVDESVAAKGVTATPTVAIYKFDTPWSPPVPWLECASEQHPELEFRLRYGEVGGDFAGEACYVSGVCISDEELEVEDVLAPEEMWF